MTNAAILLDQIHSLEEKVEQRDELISRKDTLIALLEEKLRLADIAKFSAKSEKTDSGQLGIFDEPELEQALAEPVEPTTVKSHERKARPRVSIPKELPREDIIHDLPEDEKICPHDGAVLECFGSDDHEPLDIIPAQIKVIRHKRLKYSCPCCKQHMATASKPKQPIEKSIASPGLLAYVATQKYVDALPLYRQSEIFKRIGVELDRANLANWMVKCGQLVQPLINLMIEHIQQQPVIHMDETSVQVLKEPDREAKNKSYMWVMGVFNDQPATLFHYSPTRNQTVPIELLSEQTHALMVDGYKGYDVACKKYDIQQLACWAHARRKFIEAQKAQKNNKSGKSDIATSFIRQLYTIERKIAELPPDECLKIRQSDAIPIIKKFKQWLDKTLLNTLPESLLGKALSYTANHWDRLIRYTNDGRYPIDNNRAENSIRPFVVGRKNWLFSNSQAGASASANLYSLIETAKANTLNPHAYLQHVFTQLPQAKTIEDIEALLAWNVEFR